MVASPGQCFSPEEQLSPKLETPGNVSARNESIKPEGPKPRAMFQPRRTIKAEARNSGQCFQPRKTMKPEGQSSGQCSSPSASTTTGNGPALATTTVLHDRMRRASRRPHRCPSPSVGGPAALFRARGPAGPCQKNGQHSALPGCPGFAPPASTPWICDAKDAKLCFI